MAYRFKVRSPICRTISPSPQPSDCCKQKTAPFHLYNWLKPIPPTTSHCSDHNPYPLPITPSSLPNQNRFILLFIFKFYNAPKYSPYNLTSPSQNIKIKYNSLYLFYFPRLQITNDILVILLTINYRKQYNNHPSPFSDLTLWPQYPTLPVRSLSSRQTEWPPTQSALHCCPNRQQAIGTPVLPIKSTKSPTPPVWRA